MPVSAYTPSVLPCPYVGCVIDCARRIGQLLFAYHLQMPDCAAGSHLRPARLL